MNSKVYSNKKTSFNNGFHSAGKGEFFFYCYAFSLMPPPMCLATRVDVLKSDFGSEWD